MSDFEWYPQEQQDLNIAALYDVDPRLIKQLLARAWERLPEDHELDRAWFSMGVIGYLVGMDLDDEAETPAAIYAMREQIRECFHIKTAEGVDYRIGTIAGAIHALQYDTAEEHYEAIKKITERVRERPLGVKGEWTCPFCQREFEDGTEPDKCPDCDALLMRATRIADFPKKEET